MQMGSQRACQPRRGRARAQGEKLSFMVQGVMVSEVDEEDGPQVGAQAGGGMARAHDAVGRPKRDH